MSLPKFTEKEGKNMDKNELKSKLFKGVTIALPILLVAILAMMVIIAIRLSGGEYVPTLGDNVSTTPSDTTTTVKEPPLENPSSSGLLFISYGNGTCALGGIGECTDAFIIIPSESPEGDIVTEVADGAFKNCTDIKGIEFPETLSRIGSYAFYGSTLRSIEIPSTVREIGKYALVGCKYLTEIEVDRANTNYSSSSGALYSKDGDTLITYPAGKTDSTVIIGRGVVEISNMAFYKCSYVKQVTYHGTKSSWRAVEIGAGNDVIDEAVIYYSGESDK